MACTGAVSGIPWPHIHQIHIKTNEACIFRDCGICSQFKFNEVHFAWFLEIIELVAIYFGRGGIL